MKWNANFIDQFTAASRRTASLRQQKARAKYVAMLPERGTVSKYSGHLNVKYPNDMLRRMQKYGLIRKSKFIPGHWEYEVIT